MMRALPLLLLLAACGDATRVDADPAEVVPSEPAYTARDWQRMDIDQLDAALRQTTGGIGWTENIDGTEVNLFGTLAGTLGKPEFLDSTEEDLRPGLLFQKFLGDMAKSACTDLIIRERRLTASERVFVRFVEFDSTATDAEGVRSTLVAAMLRFHGKRLQPDAPELEPWVDFVLERAAASDGETAWRATCVALLTHPDFYSY
jgi:hypothetical protein